MPLRSVALVVIAKFPAPGKVKTRLTPTYTPEQAAAVHRTFLLHLVGRLSALRPAELIISFDPPDARDAMADLLTEIGRPTLLPQCAGDLGRRIAHAAVFAAESHRRTLILAVDSPDVPDAHVIHAAELTSEAQVTIGPADDGGYWCIGLRNDTDPAALLHSGIDWSTERARAHTLANAHALGYRTAIGDQWDDVDRPEDLERLMLRLAASGSSDDARLLASLRGCV